MWCGIAWPTPPTEYESCSTDSPLRSGVWLSCDGPPQPVRSAQRDRDRHDVPSNARRRIAAGPTRASDATERSTPAGTQTSAHEHGRPHDDGSAALTIPTP